VASTIKATNWTARWLAIAPLMALAGCAGTTNNDVRVQGNVLQPPPAASIVQAPAPSSAPAGETIGEAAPTASVAPRATAMRSRPNAERHRLQVPAGTGFAAVGDADAVPLREQGKDRYRHYLTLKSPKAFVIYESGGWRFVSNDTDAMSKPLDGCAREARRCWLYAVDDRVVWSADVAKRIGKSAQIEGRSGTQRQNVQAGR
jgi:hypothetical protein